MATFTLQVNGESKTVAVDSDTPLLYILRNDLELNGPKFGCGLAQCGACTVLVDGKPVRSCVTPVSTVANGRITTIEGRSTVPRPSMVVMRPFATVDTGVTHDRTGLPSTSTVQAPHCASPQPNFGPFSSKSFLKIYRSGVSGSTDTVLVSPFTLRMKFAILPSVRLHGPVRRHQDLPAALAALRVRHGF